MGFPKLETERLFLRELTLLDAETIFQYFSKESVIRYFGMDSFENIEQAKTMIQTFKIVMKRAVYFAGESRKRDGPINRNVRISFN